VSADDDEGATPEAVDVCRHDHVDTTCPHLPSELPERVEPGNKMGNDVVEDKGVGVHCHVANVGEDVDSSLATVTSCEARALDCGGHPTLCLPSSSTGWPSASRHTSLVLMECSPEPRHMAAGRSGGNATWGGVEASCRMAVSCSSPNGARHAATSHAVAAARTCWAVTGRGGGRGRARRRQEVRRDRDVSTARSFERVWSGV